MFFADSVAVALAYFSPMPIFDIMGGIRLSEPDQILVGVMFNVQILGTLSWPVWAIAAGIAVAATKSPWSLAAEPSPSSRVTKPLWGLAVLQFAAGNRDLADRSAGAATGLRGGEALEGKRARRRGQLHGAISARRIPTDLGPTATRRLRRRDAGRERKSSLPLNGTKLSPGFVFSTSTNSNEDPARILRNAMPRGEDEDSKPFDEALSAIEKYIPANSLDEIERYDLQNLSNSDRIKVYLRNRIQTYLHSEENQNE